jgi:cytochrome P450
MDLLIAGSDTTANSVEFTILYLIKYPEVQKRLQAEIDSVMSHGNRILSIFDRVS